MQNTQFPLNKKAYLLKPIASIYLEEHQTEELLHLHMGNLMWQKFQQVQAYSVLAWSR